MSYISRNTPLPRAGKKTKAWASERGKLKARFFRVGITTCEFGYEGCWRNNGLSFAHCKKRRNLKPGELGKVALACISCHDAIEILPESEMCARVEAVIAGRAVAV